MTTETDQTIDTAIGRLVRLLVQEREEGGLSAGDHAELRRMDPLGAALPPALWRLLTLSDIGRAIGLVAAGDQETAERAFAIVVQAIAEAGPSGGTPMRIGRALGETGYAEARFVRLLRARVRPVRDLADVAFETRQAARWCAVKGATVQFVGFSRFVLAAASGRPDADRRGHAIARDYFAALTET